MYKYSHGLLSKSLNITFDLCQNVRTYNIGNYAKWNVNLCRTTRQQAAVSYLVPLLWNSQMDSLKQRLSITLFKKQTKLWFFSVLLHFAFLLDIHVLNIIAVFCNHLIFVFTDWLVSYNLLFLDPRRRSLHSNIIKLCSYLMLLILTCNKYLNLIENKIIEVICWYANLIHPYKLSCPVLLKLAELGQSMAFVTTKLGPRQARLNFRKFRILNVDTRFFAVTHFCIGTKKKQFKKILFLQSMLKKNH